MCILIKNRVCARMLECRACCLAAPWVRSETKHKHNQWQRGSSPLNHPLINGAFHALFSRRPYRSPFCLRRILRERWRQCMGSSAPHQYICIYLCIYTYKPGLANPSCVFAPHLKLPMHPPATGSNEKSSGPTRIVPSTRSAPRSVLSLRQTSIWRWFAILPWSVRLELFFCFQNCVVFGTQNPLF